MDLVESIIADKRMKPAEKLVLIVIAKKQGSSSNCQVSTGYLVVATNLSRRGVQLAVRGLLAKREIYRQRRKITPELNDINAYSVIRLNNIHRRQKAAQKRILEEIIGNANDCGLAV